MSYRNKILTSALCLTLSTGFTYASEALWTSLPLKGTGQASQLGQSFSTAGATQPNKLRQILVEGSEPTATENAEFVAYLNIYKSADGNIDTWDPATTQPLARSKEALIKPGTSTSFLFTDENAIILYPNTVYLIQIVSPTTNFQRIAFCNKESLDHLVTGSAFRNTTVNSATPLTEFSFGMSVYSTIQKPTNTSVINIGGISIGLDK